MINNQSHTVENNQSNAVGNNESISNNGTLQELAEVLWSTESYPWAIFVGNKQGKNDKEKNETAKVSFEKLFLEKFSDVTLYGTNNTPIQLKGIRFNTNYNNYDICFSSNNGGFEKDLWFYSDNGTIRLRGNNTFILSDDDKESLKKMFSFHSTIQHHKYPIQFETDKSL